jgi:hypothetical protein
MATKVTDAPEGNLSGNLLFAAVDPSAPSGSRARQVPLPDLKSELDGRYGSAATVTDLSAQVTTLSTAISATPAWRCGVLQHYAHAPDR